MENYLLNPDAADVQFLRQKSCLQNCVLAFSAPPLKLLKAGDVIM